MGLLRKLMPCAMLSQHMNALVRWSSSPASPQCGLYVILRHFAFCYVTTVCHVPISGSRRLRDGSVPASPTITRRTPDNSAQCDQSDLVARARNKKVQQAGPKLL